MFTPEYLNELVESTHAAATEYNMYLTNKVIDSIVGLFEHNGKISISPTNKHRLDLLKQSGIFMEDIEKEIDRRLPGLDKKIREAFYQAGYDLNEDINRSVSDMVESDKKLKSFVGEAPRLTNLTEEEKQILDAAYKRTKGEITNLTQTTAASMNKQFMNACDVAWWKAKHGVDTATAIKEAIDEVSKHGTHVIYKSGRKLTVEAAVRMCVLTGINQANAEITLSVCANAGIKNVLVSSHMGARYTDKVEPANHESWQGKVYALSDELLEKFGYTEDKEISKKENTFSRIFRKVKDFFQRSKNDEVYEDFETVTGYGTIEGLCGINCRHTFYPRYPGMKNNQTQYDSEENKKAYDLSQKKRSMERKIRDTKRKLLQIRHAIEKAGDDNLIAELKAEESGIKKLFDEQNDAYAAFCKQNSLRRSEDRLYVGKIHIAKQFASQTSHDIIKLSEKEQYALNRYMSSESYVLNDKLRRGKQLSVDDVEWIEKLDAALDKMPEYQGTVYRSVSEFGISDIDAFVKSHVVDGVFSMPSYLSSSERIYDESFPIQYVIESKHGKDIIAYNQGEREILFKRSSRFFVTKVEEHTIYLEEM